MGATRAVCAGYLTRRSRWRSAALVCCGALLASALCESAHGQQGALNLPVNAPLTREWHSFCETVAADTNGGSAQLTETLAQDLNQLVEVSGGHRLTIPLALEVMLAESLGKQQTGLRAALMSVRARSLDSESLLTFGDHAWQAGHLDAACAAWMLLLDEVSSALPSSPTTPEVVRAQLVSRIVTHELLRHRPQSANSWFNILSDTEQSQRGRLGGRSGTWAELLTEEIAQTAVRVPPRLAILRSRWRCSVPAPAGACARSLSNHSVLCFDPDGVRSLDQLTGQPEWTSPQTPSAANASESSPNVIPVGDSRSIVRQGPKLTAYKTDLLGTIQWQRTGADLMQSDEWTLSGSPVRFRDGLIVPLRSNTARPQFALVRLDHSTGVVQWAQVLGDLMTTDWGQTAPDALAVWQLSVEAQARPAVLGPDLVIANIAGKTLLACSATDGRPIWVRDIASNSPRSLNAPSILVSNQTVYTVTNSDSITALHVRTGREQWRTRPTSQAPRDILAQHDNLLLCRGEEGLEGINSRTGQRVWHFAPSGNGATVLDAEVLLTASPDSLWQIDIATGQPQQRWTYAQLGMSSRPTIDVLGNTLLCGESNQLISYEISRGPNTERSSR